MNFYIAKVHGAEKIRATDRQTLSIPLERGKIYVTRTVIGNGKAVEVPLKLDRQRHYREWAGCWSAL